VGIRPAISDGNAEGNGMSPGMQAGNDGRSDGNEGSPLGRVKSLGSGGKSLGNASHAETARARARSPAAIRRPGFGI
jgi:hypothetical protein